MQRIVNPDASLLPLRRKGFLLTVDLHFYMPGLAHQKAC